jgi:hypothetical protein
VNKDGEISLGEARDRLRELGYLKSGVERLVFGRAFAGRGGVLLPAWLAGALAFAMSGLAAAWAQEAPLRASPAGAGVLVFHLFVASLVPSGLVVLVVRLLADLSSAPGRDSAAAALAAAVADLGLWIAGTRSLGGFATTALVWGIPVAAAALLHAAAIRSGFLARAFAHGLLPEGPRRRVFAGALSLAVVATGVLLAVGTPEERAVSAPTPIPRREPVIVVAVDGLRHDAPDGPDARAVVAMLSTGSAGWWPARPASPPELWMDLATGEPSLEHGVRALERVRPAGSPVSLRPPLGTRWYLRGVGPRIATVESAPVSSGERRRLTFWELAASSGLPSAAVGWWASGRWPGAEVVDNREIFGRAKDGAAADEAAWRAFLPLSSRAVATVYLPGCDILRNAAPARERAAGKIREWLSELLPRARAGEIVLIVLTADSHAAPAGSTGRMTVFDRETAAGLRRIRADDVAPSILARAGVPAAEDLPGAPVPELFASGTLETSRVATWGPRVAPAGAPSRESDKEYLEKLRSLGYLN